MLNKLTLFAILLFSFAITIKAQLPLSFEVFGGGASSDFDNQESGAQGIVLGAAVHVDLYRTVDLGADFNTMITPFTIDNTEVSQTFFGLFLKYDIMPLKSFTGYVRGGVGMYSGKIETVQAAADGKKKKNDAVAAQELESTVGYNLGVGFKSRKMGFYGEVTYHFVGREGGGKDAQPVGFNNWMLVAGYRFKF